MKPPITPINMTSIGTTAPLPSKIGFRTLSDNPATTNKTVHIIAGTGSFIANK